MCCAALERAFVLEIGGDAGRLKGVVADPGFEAGDPGAALNHTSYEAATANGAH
jgi:hypothetical protein